MEQKGGLALLLAIAILVSGILLVQHSDTITGKTIFETKESCGSDNETIIINYTHLSYSIEPDCIEPNVCIWRGLSGTIKNIYDSQVEIACGNCGEETSSYYEIGNNNNWQNFKNSGCIPDSNYRNLPGVETCLWLKDSGRKWDILWTDWQTGREEGGSCPFLYTWNGKEYNFVTDLAGSGILAIPRGESYRPPEPEDNAIIKGYELKPEQGKYNIQITQEYDEVSYLDELTLKTIDHSPNKEVYLSLLNGDNKIYTTNENLQKPLTCKDEKGLDCLNIVKLEDGYYTEATETKLDIVELDFGDLSDAEEIKIIVTGYAHWIPGTSGAKALRDKIIQVKDSKGEWTNVYEGEELRNPAAMPRSYIIDLTNKFLTDDFKIRIVDGQAIRWDYIALDTSVTEEVVVNEMQLSTADLHFRGYSKLKGESVELPDYYDLKTDAPIEFSSPEGYFTKYGEVAPLLTQTDDKYVILHHGDEISIEWEYNEVPEGKERDFILHIWDYYKNKFYETGDTVKPLPFKEMSTYPYPKTENYPTENQAYLDEYNTRYYPGASIYISQLKEEWKEMYVEPFPIEYTTKEFKLIPHNKEITLRIKQKNNPFGDLEQARLEACGKILTPKYAISEGKDVLDDISKIDHNVIVIHERDVEISWDVECETAILYLTANEYGKAEPFNNLLSYKKADKVWWQPVTGHPDGWTFITTEEDSENYYFKLDITMDNTDEFGEDWTSITINGKEYKIDDYNNQYGSCSFGITEKVSYKHQTCEFKIAKNEAGEFTHYTLRYYGTGGGGSAKQLGGGFGYIRSTRGDGVECDNCPDHYNPGQEDRNNNGIGDACEDADSDGIFDWLDNCPDNNNPGQEENEGTITIFENPGIVMNEKDCIEEGTCITRSHRGEPYNLGISIIKWAEGECEEKGEFSLSLKSAVGRNMKELPGTNTCLWVVDTNNYYNIYWTGWSPGHLGGFSYIRDESTTFIKPDLNGLEDCIEEDVCITRAWSGGPQNSKEGDIAWACGKCAHTWRVY